MQRRWPTGEPHLGQLDGADRVVVLETANVHLVSSAGGGDAVIDANDFTRVVRVLPDEMPMRLTSILLVPLSRRTGVPLA